MSEHDGSGRTAEDLRSLLAPYALDAVDDVERRAVERFVAHDAEAARELASLRATVAELGAAHTAAPPDHLRSTVLDLVASTPQTAGPGGTDGAGTARPATARRSGGSLRGGPTGRRQVDAGRRRLALVGVAAASVLALAVPGVVAWQQHERAVVAEARADLLADVLADPGAQVLRGEAAGGGEVLSVLTDERALLVASDLPELDDERVYQLWAMRDGTPVPAGVLDVRGGDAQALAEEYRPGDGLAVSVEPAGGSAQPTTTPVAVLVPG